MPYHHLAVATRNMAATHVFYSRAMGFELVKVEMAPTPGEHGGWAKHFFYDSGAGELMAFWELHDETLPQDFETGLSRAAGLPDWVNHVAFAATDLDDIEARKQRWLDHGYPVMEIDHGWCTSVYTNDPGGTLVEFCVTTAAFSAEDRRIAERALDVEDPAEIGFAPAPTVRFHRPSRAPAHEAAESAA